MFLVLAISMISQQSCKKNDIRLFDNTKVFSLPRIWEISSMSISFGSSNFSPSASEIAKTIFPFFNVTFTDDGKHKTAQKSGTWTHVGGVLKLDSICTQQAILTLEFVLELYSIDNQGYKCNLQHRF